MKIRLIIQHNYYCLLYNGPSVQTEMLKLLYRMLFMVIVLFSRRSKYNAMFVIMFADYYSAHMKALYSFLIVQKRIADLRHPQFEVREMDLCPLNMRHFHEINPSISQQFCNPIPKNRPVPFCSLARLKLFTF